MRTAQWSYMKYKDGSEELYDMKKDPKQFKNLEDIQAYATERNRMRKQISQKLSALRN